MIEELLGHKIQPGSSIYKTKQKRQTTSECENSLIRQCFMWMDFGQNYAEDRENIGEN